MSSWNVAFLQPTGAHDSIKRALIVLNQPFSLTLLRRLWTSSHWRCCADGGANRLYDTVENKESYLPDLVTGDFDSIRTEVRAYYTSKGISVIHSSDQDSTDLMKSMQALSSLQVPDEEVTFLTEPVQPWEVIILGGLAGRLDQTIHTLSYLHKLRKDLSKRVFAVTDDNVGWVLNSGEHSIRINHSVLGKTCGLLPVGVDSTIISTTGLQWNLTETVSSFDGMVSTSNHLVPFSDTVWIKTTKPIWWTMELHAEITVLYFAGASTATGMAEEAVPIPINGLSLSNLRDLLISRHPNTGLDKILETCQWSVNEEMVDHPLSCELTEGAEVAVICPVSGG
ncbi:thiamine pyrophosphokinase [Guyanagaster necrorhizus]|uniref:Molybdopterin synthase sulfur carrier subunit n=1 Tax=Guyanagaster necrorhizus TaxID=856835 RepID=A0A9P7W4F8_9AGAR|nr:thiamine pyrophosphokinase [Guyanagaster necrorhizus MCA 3950]KAG7451121.1 thiamine pyrophosphokinase [Guyanagaster necrorhizus MCA 3950]